MNNKRLMVLESPVVFGKSTIESLTFRNTAAKDYLVFDEVGGAEAQNIAMIANLTGYDDAVIKKLSGRDYVAAVRVVSSLFAADRALLSVGDLADNAGDEIEKK